MIKNIIFDLGNVLISFRPAEFLDKKNYSEDLKKQVIKDVFGSQEWLMIDNGDLDIPEAIERISQKSSLPRAEIERIFNLRMEIFYSLDLNTKLLPGLKKQGFRLFYLSNFPLDIFSEVKAQYPFFSFFDGGIISAEVKCSKPDARIYRKILEKYSLNPHECLFIDDLEANVRGAESVGMKGLLTHGSTEILHDLIKCLDLEAA